MTVYVDNMRAKFGRMVMCHMVADTEDELHAMADTIGVARKWFQDHSSHPHYDIALSKRALAVAAGAIEIDAKTMAMMCGNFRATGVLGNPETAAAVWWERRRAQRIPVSRPEKQPQELLVDVLVWAAIG